MRKIVASGLAAALFAGTLGAFLAPAMADDITANVTTDTTTVAAAGSPGAARISLVSGTVAVQQAGASDTVAAAVNAPVLVGDALTTGAQARAEIQFDGRSVLRAGENAQVRFSNLDPNQTVVQIAQGTVGVDLLDGSSMRPEIDTPSVTVRPDEIGRYRVTVTGDGETFVTVRAGSADVITPQGTQTVDVGSTLSASGPAANPTINSTDAVAFDAFDSFNINRDAELDASLASSTAYGAYDAQDLGAYGQWVNDPAYGEVWVPDNQAADWAPYRDGAWAYEGPYYGYTWISYEPWGWAPYHYGRWAHLGGNRGWGWIAPRERSPWSPGLVAFFGFGAGGGVSIGLSFGNVGWVPLGPSDPFRPWWGRDHRYPMINSVAFIGNFNNYRRGGATSIGAERWKQGDFRHNEPVAYGSVRNEGGFNGRADLPIVRSSRTEVTARISGNDSWSRFSQDRGGSNGSVAARPSYRTRQSAPVNAARAQYTGGDAWSRFNQARGTGDRQQTFDTDRTQPQQRSYDRTDRTYQQPQRTYQQPQRTYQQPQQRTYNDPQRTYQQPQRTYQQPQRTYQQPQRTYRQPQRQQQQQRSQPQPSRDSGSHSDSGHHDGHSHH